jgi:hypothetical protein
MSAAPHLQVRRSPLGILLASAMCVLLVPFVAGWVDVMPPTWLSVLLGLTLVTVHLFLVGRRTLAVDPVVWVPIAMLIFYFGLIVPVDILQLPGASYDTWRLGYMPDPRRGFAAGLLTLAGLLAGIHLKGLVDPRQQGKPPPPDRRLFPAAAILAAVGITMMVIGIAIAGPSLLFGSYGDVWQAKFYYLDVRVLEVGFMLVQAAAIASIAASGPRRSGARSLGIGLCAWIGIYALLTGDRAALFSSGLALAWTFSHTVWQIPRRLVVASAAVALLSVPILKELREFGSVEIARQMTPAQLYGSAFGEMGSTVQVYSHTLDLIPRRKPYAMGLGALHAVLNLVPNPLPSRGKSFLPDPRFYSPSQWLPYTINPDKYVEGGAYGFAIGAAWYFDFGIAGMLLGMLATGAFLAWARNLAWRGSIWLVFSGLAFTASILVVRNAIASPLKLMLWPFIALLLVQAALSVFVGGARVRRLPAPAS